MKLGALLLLVVLGVLLALWLRSSTRRTGTTSAGLPSDTRQFIDAFNNRKRYASFSLETLAQITDAELEQAILDYVVDQIGEDFSREGDVLRQLPTGMQSIYVTLILQGEVDNGGFNQYFWNTSGSLAVEAVAGLRLIGAAPHADITERAIAVYEQEREAMSKYRDRGTIEAFSESNEHTGLTELDEAFYAADEAESIASLRIRYIREHPEKFVTDRRKQ